MVFCHSSEPGYTNCVFVVPRKKLNVQNTALRKGRSKTKHLI